MQVQPAPDLHSQQTSQWHIPDSVPWESQNILTSSERKSVPWGTKERKIPNAEGHMRSKFNHVLLCIFYPPLQRHQSCPAPTHLVLQVPRQQLTFKEDCRPKPGEQLKHSWQKGWRHNMVSTASPMLLMQSVLLTPTYLEPQPLCSAAGWAWTKCTHIYQQPALNHSTSPFKMRTLYEWLLIKTAVCLNLEHTN